MTYANPQERAELISGLRALATFLEEYPRVPAPLGAYVMVFPQGSDSEKRAEIDEIAALLQGAPTLSYSHYRAIRSFGLAEYRAVAIPESEGAR